jgi:hypothetical protein
MAKCRKRSMPQGNKRSREAAKLKKVPEREPFLHISAIKNDLTR